MLLIEFKQKVDEKITILYKEIDDNNWYSMNINLETLNLLLLNFGIIGKIQSTPFETASKNIKLNYCGADISLYCGDNSPFYLPLLER
jgi:hypothetical protein